MNSNSTSAGTTPTSEGHYGSSAASLGAALKSQCVRAASWESVALSASVLCGVNVVYLLTRLMDVPAMGLMFYAIGVSVVLSLPLTRVLSRSRDHSRKDEVISEQSLVELAKMAHKQVNTIAVHTRETLYWSDKTRSGLVSVGLLVCGYVCSRVRLSVLLILALNAVLLKQPATKLYNQRLAKSVNPYVHTAIQQAKGFLSKIPMLTDQIVDSKTKKI
eukprot:Protomagalhaensia_wolfi_Nauph_80__6255@NODE_952_length_1854_cov_465_569697_g719_i0_p1_GENE_NODE_952_length_1854_cov_465_569697_g719_i0NODE_952_length_1854_cov_465_569697_g719_i0_p1_ORF_typecomplete_len218_score13_12Reticulon/PF02453_17/1_7e08Reticulon/PF02453_17/0_1DUF1449/PF07290_11/0_033DUF5534/PF17686_1/0_46DUF5534/PF17686_1/9_1e02_NODE_952_length_1854_cov_465_569697_g719_i010611714